MKNREKLEEKLERKIANECTDNNAIQTHFQDLKRFGLSEFDLGQYLHMRKNLTDTSDFFLFCLTTSYYPALINEYFFPKEIEAFENLKIQKEELNGQLKINAVQISDNQWIGRVSVKDLMLWRNAQIINYNENAQRTMKHITRRGQDFYQIYLNKKAIKSIMETMKSGNYIANTLTFNMNENTYYEYDADTNTLLIDVSEEKLDILDGYHRYIAISKLYNEDSDLDFNMEIRIVNFTESTAQQFIWQEDQKTKMRKSQSDAMNQMKLANVITQRVNDSGDCDFYHNIVPNGIINKGEFAVMVDKVYCINIAKKNELEMQKETVKRLVAYLNLLADADKSLLSSSWDKQMVYTAVYLSNKTEKNLSKKKLISIFNNMYNELVSDENRKYMFKGSDVTKTDLSKMSRIYKGVQTHV